MKSELLEILTTICEEEITEDDMELNLFEEGLLDSLGFAELLVEIEEHFQVVIAPSEVERSDMDTPAKILALTEARR